MNIRLWKKELELSMLILLIPPKNAIGVLVEIPLDILDSLNVGIVDIPSTPTLMEQGILHDDTLGICAGLL